MRKPPNNRIEPHRTDGPRFTNYGFFRIPWRGKTLRAQASEGGGWDHVSVSLPDRCPTWEEMSHVKHLFFHENEVVMQLHVAAKDHVNFHSFTLHLWKPQSAEDVERTKAEWEAAGEAWPAEYPQGSPGTIPLPPAAFVGPKVAEASGV